MNITPFRRPMPAPPIWLPAGLHRVYRRCKHRDDASSAPRTSLTDGEDVTGSRRGDTSSGDLGLRVRPAWLKSP